MLRYLIGFKDYLPILISYIGNIIVIEVFQVNCPGCFLYGLPQAISIYKNIKIKKLRVFGIATAFEDYDKNNLENLKLLLYRG